MAPNCATFTGTVQCMTSYVFIDIRPISALFSGQSQALSLSQPSVILTSFYVCLFRCNIKVAQKRCIGTEKNQYFTNTACINKWEEILFD